MAMVHCIPLSRSGLRVISARNWVPSRFRPPSTRCGRTTRSRTISAIRDFLDVAFRRVGIEDWGPHVYIDPAYKRPAELFTLQGRSAKAQDVLGWRPEVSFEELVHRMVDADVARLEDSRHF